MINEGDGGMSVRGAQEDEWSECVRGGGGWSEGVWKLMEARRRPWWRVTSSAR